MCSHLAFRGMMGYARQSYVHVTISVSQRFSGFKGTTTSKPKVTKIDMSQLVKAVKDPEKVECIHPPAGVIAHSHKYTHLCTIKHMHFDTLICSERPNI